jgi:hypothetical protein
MAVLSKTDEAKIFDSRRQELIRIAREVNARAGILGEPTMTAQELRQAQVARGIRPEDNLGSRELMRMRYGDDWEEE